MAGKFCLKRPFESWCFSCLAKSVPAPNWGCAFPYYYEVDFSKYEQSGRSSRSATRGEGITSREFSIGIYPTYQDDLLLFMRQQHCGYNPYLDMVCHPAVYDLRNSRMLHASVVLSTRSRSSQCRNAPRESEDFRGIKVVDSRFRKRWPRVFYPYRGRAIACVTTFSFGTCMRPTP
jgi:hypothetical protein